MNLEIFPMCVWNRSILDEHSKLTSNITHLNLDIELDLIPCTTVVRSQQANDAPNWFFVSPQTDFLPGVFTVYRQSESKTNKQANKQKKKSKQKKSAKHCILMSDENPQIGAIKAKKKFSK